MLYYNLVLLSFMTFVTKITRWVPFWSTWVHTWFLMGFMLLDLWFSVYVFCRLMFVLFGRWIVCPFLIYNFWLHLWYLQTCLILFHHSVNTSHPYSLWIIMAVGNNERAVTILLTSSCSWRCLIEFLPHNYAILHEHIQILF
jgi:hypothetical protein